MRDPFIWRLFPFAGRVRFIKVLEREYEYLRGKEGNRRAYKPNSQRKLDENLILKMVEREGKGKKKSKVKNKVKSKEKKRFAFVWFVWF